MARFLNEFNDNRNTVQNSPKIFVIRGNCNNVKYQNNNVPILPCNNCIKKNILPNYLISNCKIINLEDAINYIDNWNKRSSQLPYNSENLEEDEIEKADLNKNEIKLLKMKQQLHKNSLEWYRRKQLQNRQDKHGLIQGKPNSNSICCMKHLRPFNYNDIQEEQITDPLSRIYKNKEAKSIKSFDSIDSSEDSINELSSPATSTKNDVICTDSYAICKIQRESQVVTNNSEQNNHFDPDRDYDETIENSDDNYKSPMDIFYNKHTLSYSQDNKYIGHLSTRNKCKIDYSKSYITQIHQGQDTNKQVSISRTGSTAANVSTCLIRYRNYNFRYPRSYAKKMEQSINGNHH